MDGSVVVVIRALSGRARARVCFGRKAGDGGRGEGGWCGLGSVSEAEAGWETNLSEKK